MMLTLEERCKLAIDCLPDAEYRTRLEALHADLLALRKDAERLDWLLNSALVIHMRSGAPSLPTQDREGIDAAMGKG